jgi:hypothetical protein
MQTNGRYRFSFGSEGQVEAAALPLLLEEDANGVIRTNTNVELNHKAALCITNGVESFKPEDYEFVSSATNKSHSSWAKRILKDTGLRVSFSANDSRIQKIIGASDVTGIPVSNKQILALPHKMGQIAGLTIVKIC